MTLDFRRVTLGLACLMLLYGGWRWHRGALAEARREGGLVADSLQAALDTTRQQNQVYLRRATQMSLARDTLLRQLKLAGRVQADLRVQVASLQAQLQAPTTADPSDTSIRAAVFPVKQAPYAGEVRVQLPVPPQPGRLTLALALDPIPLRFRVGCGPAVNSVRPATVAVEAPPWATLAYDPPAIDPQVCSPLPPGARRPSRLPWLGLGFLLGYLLH